MKIVQLAEVHTEKMGYSDVCLPRAFSKLGNTSVVISSAGNSYSNTKEYKDIFSNFLNDENKVGIKNADGYELYRLESITSPFGIYIKNLYKTLKEIKPDIVQAGELVSLSTVQCAIISLFLPFKFTVECHIHKSVFNLSMQKRGFLKNLKKFFRNVFNFMLVQIISLIMERCFPISQDSYEICNNFFLIKKQKLTIRTLGTDTEIFYKMKDRPLKLKLSLGFKITDIICIYTGRLTEDKSPHILLDAIRILHNQGHTHFKALFIGEGMESYRKLFIDNDFCKILDFVNYKELNKFYNISDIGVWPKQESTSQLDALATGLSIIISDQSGVKERAINSGLLYQEGSKLDLAKKILKLGDEKLRLKMSESSINKSREIYDWRIIAKKYENDYKKLLKV